ncbi:hypothetical protein ACEPAG_9125 [Sanghuangporus baumii]
MVAALNLILEMVVDSSEKLYAMSMVSLVLRSWLSLPQPLVPCRSQSVMLASLSSRSSLFFHLFLMPLKLLVIALLGEVDGLFSSLLHLISGLVLTLASRGMGTLGSVLGTLTELLGL